MPSFTMTDLLAIVEKFLKKLRVFDNRLPSLKNG